MLRIQQIAERCHALGRDGWWPILFFEHFPSSGHDCIGQQREIGLEHLFAYELCAVQSSLIDEHGCLRKGNKSD